MSNVTVCKCKENAWNATLNKMPPDPPRLRVEGTCTCPTTGFGISLLRAEPQGINPDVLLLDLKIVPPQMSHDTITDYPLTYSEEARRNYTHVTIRECNLTIPVKIVT
jgi:hypothetical protein